MNEKMIERILLPGLFMVFTLSNLAWLIADTAAPRSDSIYYIQGSYKFLNAIRTDGILGVASVSGLVRYRPPLQSLAGALVTLFVGMVPDRIVLVNIVWLALTAWAVYWLGKRLSGVMGGLFASLFFMTNPFVHEYLSQFETEVPLLFVVSLTLIVLHRLLERCWIRDYVYLGVLLSCGLLFKWIYAVIVFTPVLLAMIWDWRLNGLKRVETQQGVRWGKRWGIALGIPAVVALPWYASQFPALLSYQADVSQLKFYTPFTEGWSWITMVYYPALLAVKIKIIHLVCFLCGSIGCVVLWKRGRETSNRIFIVLLGLALAVPWVYFILFYSNLAQKYLLPVQPVIAVFASCFIPFIKPRWIPAIVSIIGGILILVSIQTQWGIPRIDTQPKKTTMGIWLKPESGVCSYPANPPRKIQIPFQDLAESIAEKAKPLPRPMTVLTVPNIEGFSAFTLSIWLDAVYPGCRSEGISKYRIILETIFHDFLITKQGQAHGAMIHHDELDPFRFDTTNRLSQFLENPPEWFNKSHQVAGRFPFMNKADSIALYERTTRADGEEGSEWIGFFADEIVRFDMLWDQIEIAWRFLRDPTRQRRAGRFKAALHGGDTNAMNTLISEYRQSDGSWYPYEEFSIAVIAERGGETGLAREIFQKLSDLDVTCSQAAARRLDEPE